MAGRASRRACSSRLARSSHPANAVVSVRTPRASGTQGTVTSDTDTRGGTSVAPAAGDAPAGHLVNLSEMTVIKAGNVYAVTERDGSLPLSKDHPLGLYRDDCRFLSGHAWTVNGRSPLLLVMSAGLGSEAVHELTNPPLGLPDGRVLPLQALQLRFERRLGSAEHVEECLAVESYHREPVDLELVLALRTDFQPMLAIRGIVEPGRVTPDVERVDGGLRISARGRDGVHRALTVTAEPSAGADPASGTLSFRLHLEPSEKRRI